MKIRDRIRELRRVGLPVSVIQTCFGPQVTCATAHSDGSSSLGDWLEISIAVTGCCDTTPGLNRRQPLQMRLPLEKEIVGNWTEFRVVVREFWLSTRPTSKEAHEDSVMALDEGGFS